MKQRSFGSAVFFSCLVLLCIGCGRKVYRHYAGEERPKAEVARFCCSPGIRLRGINDDRFLVIADQKAWHELPPGIYKIVVSHFAWHRRVITKWSHGANPFTPGPKWYEYEPAGWYTSEEIELTSEFEPGKAYEIRGRCYNKRWPYWGDDPGGNCDLEAHIELLE